MKNETAIELSIRFIASVRSRWKCSPAQLKCGFGRRMLSVLYAKLRQPDPLSNVYSIHISDCSLKLLVRPAKEVPDSAYTAET